MGSTYRDKKVVGVFVRFLVPLRGRDPACISPSTSYMSIMNPHTIVAFLRFALNRLVSREKEPGVFNLELSRAGPVTL
jgi:hypothetical protein